MVYSQTLGILVGFCDTIHGVCHSQTSLITHRKIPLWKIKLKSIFSKVSLQYKINILFCVKLYNSEKAKVGHETMKMQTKER